MKISPQSAGEIHFIGIGGIGMSGIAELLHNRGYHVRGSDINLNANVERLQKLGISVTIGHKAESILGANVVVVSSDIKLDNPEIKAAREQSIPVVMRAEMLAELMQSKFSVAVAGTHGKTTTTSLSAAILETGGFDPVVVNGGIINAYGTNMRQGHGDWFVAEADESDGSFLKLPRTITIVTNIDPEHMEYYKDFETLKKAFKDFVLGIPFYGLAILCKDHPEVSALAASITDRRVVTYGLNPKADIYATNIRPGPQGSVFDVVINERFRQVCAMPSDLKVIKDVFLSMLGEHNVQNALSTIALGLELGMDVEHLKQGLSSFQGVSRRFTAVGNFRNIQIIDDYAHHPEEIKVVLKTATTVAKGKVIAIFQPHRYSRLGNLFNEFCNSFSQADAVVVTPIYGAGEKPVPGLTQEHLVSSLKAAYKGNIYSIDSAEALAPLVFDIAASGDYVVCLGAGTITSWARGLQEKLESLAGHMETKSAIG